jgi:predicted ATPase/DNA-binding CsgD family transcriptional regulator
LRLIEARHNLPVPLTSFVGRQRELEEIEQLLTHARLVTLIGPPGVGKTRLALVLGAALVDHFADGVWLIDLAPASEPDQVVQAIAAATGVREAPGRALDATLTEALRSQELLLILDNCEHLVAACAIATQNLLRTCPGVRVLATSREPLRAAGETTWRVPALSIPEPRQASSGVSTASALAEYEAIQLFVERARAALPNFALTEHEAAAVVSICRQLDGLPLAVELAAARVRSLGIEQLARRLDDRFRVLVDGDRAVMPRQQTLLALLDWGHALLTEPEQVLLRRLSIFSGGWLLDAAEAVCAGDGLEKSAVVPLLLQLVDKSHVMADHEDGDVRYRLLETLRQYAAEKLKQAGEERALRVRHLAYFVELAEHAEDRLWGPDEAFWFDRLERESLNFRAALEWSTTLQSQAATDPAVVEAGLRLGGALWHFWVLWGHPSEGAALRSLLATGEAPRDVRAKACHALAYLAFIQGNAAEGSRLAGETLELGRHSLPPFLVASALVGLAEGALYRGDAARATALCEEGLSLCRAVDERRGMYYALYGLADVARSQGDQSRAIELMQEAHVLTREQGDPWSIAFALSILGNHMLLGGDADAAEALQCESLALRQSIHDAVGIGRCLDGLGWVASSRGDHVRAARLFGAAEALRERIGAAAHVPWQTEHERHCRLSRDSLGPERFATTWAEGHSLGLDDTVAYALGAQAPFDSSQLSSRELQLVALIAQGRTNREIAAQLATSEWTIERQIRAILTKLGLRSRSQIAAWRRERGNPM